MGPLTKIPAHLETHRFHRRQEMVYDLIGALGGPFCKHGPRQLFANREEARSRKMGWDRLGWVRPKTQTRVGFYGFVLKLPWYNLIGKM